MKARTPTAPLITAGLAALLLVVVGEKTAAAGGAARDAKRVVILGIDGLDPGVTRRLMEAGRLPHLRSIAEEGTFGPLSTSMPPLSPVAWTNFITGRGPGAHGVYGFLHCDPARIGPGFTPADGVTRQERIEADWPIPGTPWVWPGKVERRLRRRAPPFWRALTQRGIPATFYKLPASFPVPEKSRAEVLAGMGTPDIAGTYGQFTLYVEEPEPRDDELRGGTRHPVTAKRGTIVERGAARGTGLPLGGGPNPYRRARPSRVARFEVYRDAQRETAAIWLQGQQIVLTEGEWSGWQRVSFPGPAGRTGGVRFYLQSAAPEFRLYASPVNLTPGASGLANDGLARALERALGPYYTAGMAEQTKGFLQGVLSRKEFLEQCRLVLRERVTGIEHLLRHRKSGLLFLYVSTVDAVSHTLWGVDAEKTSAPGPHMEALYERIDALIGRVRRRIAADDTVLVISDHGFASMRKQFNLAAWLKEQGHLALRPEGERHEGRPYGAIDWKRTKAYPVGFQGLSLNLAGREASGIVEPAQRQRLLKRIRRALLDLRHEGRPVFASVERAADRYGERRPAMPDLLLGYRPPFGPADRAVLGKLEPETIRARKASAFRGHHATAAELVPGVFFSTEPDREPPKRLRDVAARARALLGVQPERENPDYTGG